MLVGPLYPLRKNAAIRRLLGQVGCLLHQAVSRLKVAAVKGRTVSNHDLRRVFVRHDDRGLGKLRAHGIWIVGH